MEKFIQKHLQPHTILPTYVATEKTFTIIPVKHTDYSSLVVEKDHVYHVRQTPLEIIDESCGEDFTTYEGRRNFIVRETGFSYKVPILTQMRRINISFPTMSASQFECIWLFPKSIIKFNDRNSLGSSVIFENNLELFLPISYHTLKQQFQRSYMIHRLADHVNNR